MQVVGVQMDIAWEDKTANFARVRSLLDSASVQKEALVVLPEMFATGFSMNVMGIAEDSGGETERFLSDTAREFGVYLLGGIVTRGGSGKGRNQSVVYGPDGREVARYTKMQPFAPGGEAKHYESGAGPILLDWQGLRVAPFVCYDLRFPEIFRAAVTRGAQLYTVIASWPEARIAHWVALLQARAIENQAYVIGVNRVGGDPYFNYVGRSLIVDPRGEILADAGDREGIISADIDPALLTSYRRDLPFLADIRSDCLPDEPPD